MSHKTIGVIGGLGPEATLDFFSKVLARTPAKKDEDHLHLIINNNPKVPNCNESLMGIGPSSENGLIESAKALERAGADCLVLICNTAHVYQNAIETAVSLPFISMIDAVVKASKAQEVTKVGILATDGCLAAGLYQKAFQAERLQTLCLEKDAQARLMQLISQIKAGLKENTSEEMRQLAKQLIEQGADVIIAGCTEIPLVLKQKDLCVPLIESTDALINDVFAFAQS